MVKVPETQSFLAGQDHFTSFRYTPLRHMRSVFVRFLQGLFGASRPGMYKWDPDDVMSEILIFNENKLDPEVVEKKPCLSLTRASLQAYSLGMDDMTAYDFQTGRKEKDILLPGTMVVNCVSKVMLEAEDLAWVVFEHVWLLRDLLMKVGFFEVGRGISISAPSPAGSMIMNDRGEEFYLVAVACPFQFGRKSAITPLSTGIVRGIEFSLGVRSPRSFVPQGVPAQGVNIHECSPEPWSPASDAHGDTPDPADTNDYRVSLQTHPLIPGKKVFVRRVYPNRPGQAHSPASVPIKDPCVEQSPL